MYVLLYFVIYVSLDLPIAHICAQSIPCGACVSVSMCMYFMANHFSGTVVNWQISEQFLVLLSFWKKRTQAIGQVLLILPLLLLDKCPIEGEITIITILMMIIIGPGHTDMIHVHVCYAGSLLLSDEGWTACNDVRFIYIYVYCCANRDDRIACCDLQIQLGNECATEETTDKDAWNVISMYS